MDFGRGDVKHCQTASWIHCLDVAELLLSEVAENSNEYSQIVHGDGTVSENIRLTCVTSEEKKLIS